MDEIVSELTIASLPDVRENNTHDYDRVVSVCQDTAAENVGCTYSHINLAPDITSGKQYGGSASYGTFQRAADAVLSSLALDEKVLVHCHRGQNRSPAVAAAALAVYNHTSYDYEINRIQEARPEADVETIMKYHAKQYVSDNGR